MARPAAFAATPWSGSPPCPWLLRAFVLVEVLLIAAGMRAALADWPVVVAFTVGFVTGAQGITFAPSWATAGAGATGRWPGS